MLSPANETLQQCSKSCYWRSWESFSFGKQYVHLTAVAHSYHECYNIHTTYPLPKSEFVPTYAALPLIPKEKLNMEKN